MSDNSDPKRTSLDRVQRAARRAQRAQADYERAAGELQQAVKEASAGGHSLSEIARVAGYTRQRIHQIFHAEAAPVFPPWGRGRQHPGAKAKEKS